MAKKLLFLLPFSLLLLLFSCNPKKKITKNLYKECDTTRINAHRSTAPSGKTATWISNEFIRKAPQKLSIRWLQQNHADWLSLKKEPFQNIHDTSRIDTIYHFTAENDTVRFYRSRPKDLLIHLDVTNPRLSLTRCIRPGLPKTTFMKIFGITPPTKNKIRIRNREGTLIFIFYFQKGKLQRIQSDIYFG